MYRAAVLIGCFAIAWTANGVDFESNSNKVYLPIQVNEKGPFWFILDTGSVSNVLDAERAKSLGIATAGNYEVHGAGEGSLKASSAKNIKLHLGDILLRKQEVEILPINRAISFSEGRVVDGLIGCPFFERFIVEIDYTQRQVTFQEPKTFKYSGSGQAIPIELRRGNIFVNATLVLRGGERVSGTFLVDTAWRAALSLNTPFVEAHHLPGKSPTILATSGVGIGGPSRDRVGRIDALEFGPYTIKEPITDFSEAKSGVMSEGGMAGIIGGEILRRFGVVLDYPNHRLLLEPNEQFDEPYNFDMSGLFLTAYGSDLRSFKIYFVVDGSPAAETGLRPEDFIETINGESARNFTLEQIRQMFKHEGQQYSLGVRRGDQTIQAKLITRRLI